MKGTVANYTGIHHFITVSSILLHRCFFHIKDKALHQQKNPNSFFLLHLALLQWSGTKPTNISKVYLYRIFGSLGDVDKKFQNIADTYFIMSLKNRGLILELMMSVVIILKEL